MTNTEFTEVSYVQFVAAVASLIGLAGLVALMSQSAFAVDNKGFQPGGKAFTNPFANVNPGAPGPGPAPDGDKGNNFFDDDEDMEPDFPGEGAMNPPPSRAAGGNIGNPGANPATQAMGTPGGVSVGGGPAGGVVQHTNVRSIQIDSETGEGSKEIVTDFNYPDADIMDIAKTLGKLTGKNFIIDKDVKGRITIISNGPITVGDAWKAFLTALDINGFALIPSGKFIRIARQRDARDKQLKTYTGDFSPDTDALITRVFPLKYINAEEVARTFRSFMPANSRIIPYEQTNTVIVTDTGSNISKLNKMLELLDVEGYDAGIAVIPVKYASAPELSKIIDALIPGRGAAPGVPPGAPRFGGAGGRFSARRTNEGGIINTIIADERTNTLIVHANTRGADQVRELVAKLDQKQPALSGGGGKLHVYYLQFADAEAISNTLNNLTASTGGGFKAVPPGGGVGVNPVGASLFEGSIKVSPDKATNSLVITASPGDYVTVQRVINRLDIPRDEVFVEVIVMEVAIDRGSTYSANVISPASAIGAVTSPDLFNFLTNPLSAKGLALGFVGGASKTITGPNGTPITVSSVQGLITAIQSTTRTNVLATPQIIALDNTEATFVSAEKIPVPVTTQVQGVGTTTGIQKESVELSIKIKPQINKISNFVKLETEIKLGDLSNRAVPSALQTQAFATLDRSAKTTVVVADTDTIVIGGLIRDKISEGVTKIPILGDIPILGWLFKSKTSQAEKTNLLVFLTPHIIRQYEKVRTLLDRKLKERDDFLETNGGGEDPMRAKRDDIIRSLPDLKALTANKPESSITIDEDKPTSESEGAREVKPDAGGNPAPLLNVPELPPSAGNTGAAEVLPPAPTQGFPEAGSGG